MTSRRLVLTAALGAAARLLVGCEAPEAEQGRGVARLWFNYGGRNREVLERLVDRFNRSQREHFIRATYQGDYYEGLAKLRTALAARAAPALSHVVGEVVPYLASAGVLEPLEHYPRADAIRADLIPELAQARSWQGGDRHPLVTLPFNRSTPIAYLNADEFARAGATAPHSWDELREVARALTRRDGDRTTRYGFGCPISWWFWVALVGQAGGDLFDSAGRVTLGGPAGVEALRYWQTLVSVDRSMKPPPGRDYNAWEQTNQDFLAGRVAMIWTSTAFLKYLEDNARFRVVAVPLPVHRRAAVPTGGTHWVLLRSAPEAEKRAAWAFLRFMHDPEQVIDWATQTGYLPVTRSAVQRLERSGYYASHPNDRVALDQLAVAMPWAWNPLLFRIERESVEPRLESAVLAQGDAQQLLDAARREAAEG